MTAKIETVHLIFKTHLDIGFTALARDVVTQYFEEFFPRAIEVAETLRRSRDTERFIWTTGSWLIYEYLEKASPQDRRRLEAAIESGDIAWHGLPFTTHSELMDASLFRFGLSLSQELDRRFGKQTIAAKMTDVPGHTRAIVPLLAECGIKFLHVGVNAASTPPQVPPVFVWRDANGAEVVVMYHHGYGGRMTLAGLSAALVVAQARDEKGDQDNLSPQTTEQVIEIFSETREHFPEANVIASTLDAYARQLTLVKSHLPVVTEEIGDTWIHGVGTDPKKVSQFRELCRLRNQWVSDQRVHPNDEPFAEFSRSLLLIPEHTWGLDEKTYLADYVNYRRGKFDRARVRASFKMLETSWAEQRAYLDHSIQALGDSPLAVEAVHRLKYLQPKVPDRIGFEEVSDIATVFETAHFAIGFDVGYGAVSHLIDKKTQKKWASSKHLLGLVRYQTFSQTDYDRFLSQYLSSRPPWAVPDFSKPGIAEARARSEWWLPSKSRLFMRKDEFGHQFILELFMPQECVAEYGCPKTFTIEISLPDQEPSIDVGVQWFQKPANRLPEAIWFSFCLQTRNAQGWMMDKMGKHISPLDVVRNGNRQLHAVGRGVFYRDPEHELTIETFDAPLVAPGEPSLLDFNNEQPNLDEGVHFNLYNNVWGTNFPMWYEEDARFRFRVSTVAPK